jgi:anti-sigma regulatory factor (Ser/Thr protein kinase)
MLPEPASGRPGTAVSSIRELNPTAGTELAAPSGGSPSPRRQRWRLRALESSVPSIRWELRAFLCGTWLTEDGLQDVVLAACEAATNAVDHPQRATEPFIDITAEIDGAVLIITVHDHGRWLEPARSPFRGRGLRMMHALADTTITSSALGTTVTLRSFCAASETETATEVQLQKGGQAS